MKPEGRNRGQSVAEQEQDDTERTNRPTKDEEPVQSSNGHVL